MTVVQTAPASVPALDPPDRAPRTRRKGDCLTAWAFLLPSIVGFAVFFVYPAVRGVYYSTTDWNLLSPPKSVGLANYRAAIHDPEFWKSLRVTTYFVVLSLVAQLAIGLVLAGILHRLLRSVMVRAVLLLPWLVPNVTIGLLWMWMLDTNLGFANHLLHSMGHGTEGFLTDPNLALPSIAGITTWAGIGYIALLFYAGMLQIPQDVYQSAQLDGAGEIRMFFGITLPLLRPIIALVLVVSVIGSFQIFDVVAVTTAGGPVGLTKVIYYYIYEEAFHHFRMGYASAMALCLALVLGVLTWVQMRLLRASTSDLG